jgi:hypothetical protein
LEGRVVRKKSWPVSFSAIKSPPPWIANTATAVAFLLALILVFPAVIAIARLAIDLLGNDTQRASDAVKSLLPIAAAAVGLPLIVWRLVILSQQTQISEAKTQIDRETYYTSLFAKSVDLFLPNLWNFWALYVSQKALGLMEMKLRDPFLTSNRGSVPYIRWNAFLLKVSEIKGRSSRPYARTFAKILHWKSRKTKQKHNNSFTAIFLPVQQTAQMCRRP